MAAAEEVQEDALFVLTAALLTPGQYPGALGDDYPAACAGLGLDPIGGGYGLVFGQDGTGARWTVAITDTWMVACALAAWDCGLEYDLSPPEHSVAASLPGWPVSVAVAVPGIPGPFDPAEESTGRAPLTPPDPGAWGPAQRRLGADEIAVRWREWRDQFDPAPAQQEDVEGAEESGEAAAGEGTAEAAEKAAAEGAEKDTGKDAANTPGNTPNAPDKADAPDVAPDAAEATGISHPGVRRVLQAAEEYVRTPPPPGRVRVAYGSVRADGPGWSLVGRPDDMAFVLLDDAPGEVLPVGRGRALPALMEALGRLATAPPTGAATAS